MSRELFRQQRCDSCTEAAQKIYAAVEKAAEIEQRLLAFAVICPALYQETDPSRLHSTFYHAVRNWEYGARGLGLVGVSGTGKTRSAYWLIKRLFVIGYQAEVTTATAFTRLCVDQFSDDKEGRMSTVRTLKSFYSAPLLLLDDLGKQRMTERAESELYAVLEYRASKKLPIIWTADATGSALRRMFSEEYRNPLCVGSWNLMTSLLFGSQQLLPFKETNMQKLPKFPWPSRQQDSNAYQKCCKFLLSHLAQRDDSKWPMARAHLLESYLLDPGLIDQLYDAGSIYADHSNIMFPHRVAGNGDIIGASLQRSRGNCIWMPIGDDRNAWFVVGNLELADSVVAVESPIEALSYFTLFPRRRGGFAVVSCSGIRVPCKLMVQLKEHKQTLTVAFSNTVGGNRGVTQARKDGEKIGLWVSSENPHFPTWNEDLRCLKKLNYLSADYEYV